MSLFRILIIFIVCITISTLSSCNTGIESTKTISLSKEAKKNLLPTREELLMNEFSSPVLPDWNLDRKFLITDNRASLIFIPVASNADVSVKEGTLLYYTGYELRNDPGGIKKVWIFFSDGSNSYEYNTGRTEENAKTLTTTDIPLSIDLNLVNNIAEKLEGTKVWTRSDLWYDSTGEKIPGMQFVTLTVKRVYTGNKLFPINLLLSDRDAKDVYMYMNFNNSGLESRTFKNLFYLSDPKLNHQSISDEIWELICRRKVKEGMTKEECRLALGTPVEVNSGHDWNSTIDIWNYGDGSYLTFQDGILVSFRI